MMSSKEFFTIKRFSFAITPNIPVFHFDITNRLPLINLYPQEVLEFPIP